jgi:hypothetical protein
MTPEMIFFFVKINFIFFERKYAEDNPEIPEPITATFIRRD